MSNALSFHSKDLTLFEKPDVLVNVDYETLLKERIAELNALKPLLFDDSTHQPVLMSAELIESDDGNYWKVPVNSEAGLLYLDLESEPLLRLLQADVYREMNYRNMLNKAALSLMPAYATGNSLDNLALQDRVYRFDGEDDERFRRRWLLSPESKTAGGSEGWYLFHALSADPRVKDAMALSPTPRGVTIVVLSTEGNGDASQDLLDAVEASIKDQYTEVMSDELTVVSAEIIEYQVDATARFKTGVSTALVTEKMNEAFLNYRESTEKIGYAIDKNGIMASLYQEGVYRVTAVTPEESTDLTLYQAPYCSNLIIREGEEHGLL